MIVPDIVGFELGQGLKLLEKAGISVNSITVTSPPREKLTEYDNSFRIIRVNFIKESNNVDLLVVKPL